MPGAYKQMMLIMTKRAHNIYQFKIILDDIKIIIWRRIKVVDSYSFWDLHVAIQDAMGWTDSHLHVFEINNSKTGKKDSIGIPDEDGSDDIPGWEALISSYFTSSNNEASYEYDFGDSWSHKIVLEKILPIDINIKYPQCLAGAGA